MGQGFLWEARVREALTSKEGMNELLTEVGILYRLMALRIAPQCVEDCVQNALLKLWRRLDRVDLSRPETIKQFVMLLY